MTASIRYFLEQQKIHKTPAAGDARCNCTAAAIKTGA